MTVEFQIEGQNFVALNGGPHFKINEAISFVVNCMTQKKVDYFWKKLSSDGRGQCGWLKDKFGVSWQIVPAILPELLSGKDTAKSHGHCLTRPSDSPTPVGRITGGEGMTRHRSRRVHYPALSG